MEQGHGVIGSPGHLVTVSPGHRVTGSPGHRITGSQGHKVIGSTILSGSGQVTGQKLNPIPSLLASGALVIDSIGAPD